MSSRNGQALAERVLGGDRRALARLLTLLEDGRREGERALAALYPRAGGAHVVGLTGSTGTGKSTLLTRVARAFRARDVELAVVAVDPTSPISGGALLGDRLRMRDLVGDPGIFIRSMASRGHPGGVAHATRDVITALDAAGFPLILVETVGSGQAQVAVAQVVHTVVLVEAPGMGDDIQALKAGLLEIADVIVVNKADRPEAKRTVVALQTIHTSADRGHHRPGTDRTPEPKSPGADPAVAPSWQVPILETSATSGQGIDALVDAIMAHRTHLQTTEAWDARQTRHARAAVRGWLLRHFEDIFDRCIAPPTVEAAIRAVVDREQDPASAAQDLLAAFLDQVET
jgi:LAO/AO transport system kinase